MLLVHRAILFGLLGAALIAAIFCDQVRPYAIGAVLVSDLASLASLAIVALNPGINDSMSRVVRADVISIVLLVIAAVSELVRCRSGVVPRWRTRVRTKQALSSTG